MKKILSLSLALIMAMALVGCGHTKGDSLGPGIDVVEEEVISPEPDTKDMNEQQIVGVPNPLIEVDNTEAIAESLGINIDAPDGATNIEYGIIANEIAHIVYDLDEKTFVLRASKSVGGQELSGMHGDFEMTSYVACGDTVSVTVDTVELDEGNAFATSTVEMMDNDTVYLALSTANQISGDEISSMINKMSYAMADATRNAVDAWGITLTATDVTSTGLTIVCEQVDGEQQGELQTGSPYCLEVFKDSTWQAVSYLPLEYEIAWTMEAWNISLNDTTEWNVDWEWLYGELPSGTYRIGKSVIDWIEAGNYEEQMYYAEFEIA